MEETRKNSKVETKESTLVEDYTKESYIKKQKNMHSNIDYKNSWF